MRVRQIDGDGDWTFGKGQNDYVRDRKATAQMIKTRLQEFLGDCFFNIGAGLDWFNLLGNKDQTALNLSISTKILNTEGVSGIKQLNVALDPVTRNYQVSYAVDTVYGPMFQTFTFDVST